MVSLKHFLFTALLAVAACAPTPSEPPNGAAQEEVAELWTAETRTILTGDAARSLARQCSRISPGPVEEVWTPTDAEVAAIEDELILLVARELEEASQSPSPGGYYRQYAGFVIGGQRVIYVNGVDDTAIQRAPNPNHPFDWRTQPVQICDGGTITFGAEYNPATHRFSNFAFNGAL
ncbi:MAG TPA: hypothetical protein VEF55_05610 [Candidatus Binatia bacterium]|nr:hypothetical protein [Candidatus Binatia bacterium]